MMCGCPLSGNSPLARLLAAIATDPEVTASDPRRRRRTGPQVPESFSESLTPASEWRVRMALALTFVSAASALANLVALLALGGAIAHLGAPQGPLEFALAFIGAVVGLGGDVLIFRGALAVVQPQSRFAGHPERVTWGLGLQLLASALVGVLESSWLFGAVYVLILAGLTALWLRNSPALPPRPAARHPVVEPDAPLQQGEQIPDRLPIPWVGTAPPPPSSPPRAADGLASGKGGSSAPVSPGRGPGL